MLWFWLVFPAINELRKKGSQDSDLRESLKLFCIFVNKLPEILNMNKFSITLKHLLIFLVVCFCQYSFCDAQTYSHKFRVIAFFSEKKDPAHISFDHEANQWFPKIAAKYHFTYDSSNDWNNLNTTFLSKYDVVIFLDTRPDSLAQRLAFQKYMERGGAWMGFHFAAFALTPSEYPQNWDWYHETFLGAGQYISNTWRPTSAILRVEDRIHPITKGLPERFKSAPNEWYLWENDLRRNPSIKILLSIDSSSYPLGTGPKLYEIWHSGYYPVAWTNINYKMVYFNMGHNDMDYEHKFDSANRTLSSTFASEMQNRLIINALLWLGSKGKNRM